MKRYGSYRAPFGHYLGDGEWVGIGGWDKIDFKDCVEQSKAIICLFIK
jgi:hypothetical protein